MPGRFNRLFRRRQRAMASGVAVFLLGTICGQSLYGQTTNASSAWQNAKEGGSNVWQNVKEGASNTWSAVKNDTTQGWENARSRFASATIRTNYAYADKNQFVGKAKTELNAIRGQIKRLSDETADASQSVKTEMQQKIAALKVKQVELEKKYNDAENATEADWSRAQSEFQQKYDQTKNSVKDAWHWLKSKTDE